MTHFNRTLALIAFCCSLQDFAAAQDTLYKRLGGFDAVSAVVEDFAPKLFTDPVVGFTSSA